MLRCSLLVTMLLGLRLAEGLKFEEEGSVNFGAYLDSVREYVSNIVLSQDGTLAFALIGNVGGSKQKVVAADLSDPGKIVVLSKALSLSVGKLEMVTLDNKRVLTKYFESLLVSDLLNSSISTVNVETSGKTAYESSGLVDAMCIRPGNSFSSVVVLTRTGGLYLFAANASQFSVLSSGDLSNVCGIITASPTDSTVYGFSKTNGTGIRILNYQDTSAPQSALQTTASIPDTADLQRQILVSPLGNYLAYLSGKELRLYAVQSSDSLSYMGSYATEFSAFDFLNETTILACELLTGTSTVLEFNSSGEIETQGNYTPKSLFGTLFVKTIRPDLVAIGDSTTLKLIRISAPASQTAKGSWNLAVLVFGSVMAVLMVGLASYAFCRRRKRGGQGEAYAPRTEARQPVGNNTNTTISLRTEVLPTDQDVPNYAQVLKMAITCPLAQEVMSEPVILADGYSYEKKVIEEWLKRSHLSPVTGEGLANSEMVENCVLVKLAQIYRRRVLSSQPTQA